MGKGPKAWSIFMDAASNQITIQEAQGQVDRWIREVGVRYFSELTNLAQLVEEVGELARIMARRYGDQSWKPHAVPGELGDELADILFVLICIANQTGVDLSEAFRASLDKKTQRDFQRHQSNEKLKDSVDGDDRARHGDQEADV